MKKIVIIDYGAGNTQSLQFAIQNLGYETILSADEEVIRKADYVFFPGVGHADQALKVLKEKQLIDIIKDLKQPFMGICLGMQMMGAYLAEADNQGLEIVSEAVGAFKGEAKVPHMGWNQVDFKESHPLFQGIENDAFFYFVHSYRMGVNENTIATCDYEAPFTAIIQKENFYGCQFHPEKSGKVGLQVIQNFLNIEL